MKLCVYESSGQFGRSGGMDIIKITLYTCMKLSENKNYMKIYKTRHGFTPSFIHF